MCAFRIAWRVLLLGAIFLGVGFATSHLVIQHAVERGTREYDVRLAGLMAGLFAAGMATLVIGFALFAGANKRRGPSEES